MDGITYICTSGCAAYDRQAGYGDSGRGAGKHPQGHGALPRLCDGSRGGREDQARYRLRCPEEGSFGRRRSRRERERERYEFRWPDKSKARALANTPTSMVLRPCREDSVDFDNTKNIYIEGDNLEVLKILRETYLHKVKMIYIDPPYNTGNDFIYNDNFSESRNDYDENSGDFDLQGNRLYENTTSNGRFHTNWLNMMFSRLILAKDFLSPNGTIFISIDEHEQHHLRSMCDEIFGTQNYVGDLIWESTTQPTNAGSAKFGLQKKTEVILVYRINKTIDASFQLKETGEQYNYPDIGKNGKCRFELIETSDSGNYTRSTMKFPILGQYPRPGKRWKIGEDTARQLEKEGKIEIKNGLIYRAVYPEDDLDKSKCKPFWSLLRSDQVGTAQKGKEELNSIMGAPMGFDTVKPVELIKELISHIKGPSIIMDFFSGSGTTAQAVMEHNLQYSENNTFIIIQSSVLFKEKDDAYRAGYPDICSLARERIKRSGVALQKKIDCGNLDTGFRVFRLDTSNDSIVGATPEKINQMDLSSFVDTIKTDRTPEDLLIQSMLAVGIPLSVPIKTEEIGGHTLFDVDDGYLIAVLDEGIDEDTVTNMAKHEPKPQYAVIRTSASITDAMLSNIEQIFRTYSPGTTIRRIRWRPRYEIQIQDSALSDRGGRERRRCVQRSAVPGFKQIPLRLGHLDNQTGHPFRRWYRQIRYHQCLLESGCHPLRR